MLRGVGASAGIGIGKAVVYILPKIEVPPRAAAGVAAELRRFERAADVFCTQISRLATLAATHFGASEAGIITSQIVVMQDPELRTQIIEELERGCSAEGAVCAVFDGYISHFSALEDELIRARAADFKDMRLRLLTILAGEEKTEPPQPPANSVLVADEITPSAAAALLPAQLAAVVTANGNPSSHMAILARALQIPTVVSAPSLLEQIAQGDKVIVNGGTGEIILRPTSEELHRYWRRRQHQTTAKELLEAICSRKTTTRDGRRVSVTATLNELKQLPELADKGPDGVGFFRTDYLYAENALPGEQQQFLAYRAIARTLKGKKATICTLDINREAAREPNPSLGFRAVRYSLAHQDQFKVQLTAILRASAFGNLQIVAPMVTTLGELRQVRLLLEECKRELALRQVDYDPNIQLGVVIETPAAAIIARTLAKEADFFILGDALAQYTLAADQSNRRISDTYNSYHPAVLMLLAQAIQAAQNAFVPVGVSGEMSCDPMLLPFLIGCGIDEISVPPAQLFSVRQQLENLNYLYWKERVPVILSLSTAKEAVEYIKRNWAERPAASLQGEDQPKEASHAIPVSAG